MARLTIIPVTLAGLRAVCGDPTMPLEACVICKAIPRHCRRFEKGGEVQEDDIPPEVAQLEPFIGTASSRGEIVRCPTCCRLYRYESEYEFIYGGSEDTYDYRRVEIEELFRSEAFVKWRVADGDLVGRVLAEEYPSLPVDQRRVISVEGQKFFRRHSVVAVALGEAQVWIALSDDAPSTILTANLDGLARIAVDDPPGELDQRERAIAYGLFADRVTSEYRYGCLCVDAFDSIPWRDELTEQDRAQIEDLRSASPVAPQHVEASHDGFVIRRWLVAHQKLICRIVTVLATGELRREDAIVGEAIPTHLGKRWSWNHKRKRREPIG